MMMFTHLPTMLRMAWLSLKRDRVALLLTFALPIAFFSIFVGIFGSTMTSGGGGTSRISVALVDEDQSPNSQRFVDALRNESGLRIVEQTRDEPPQPLTRDAAEAMVKSGQASVAVVIPAGFGETFMNFDFASRGEGDRQEQAVEILADNQRNPIAPQVVAGLMQKAAMTGAPDVMIERGIGQFEQFAGDLTPQQRTAMDAWLPLLRQQSSPDASGGTGAAGRTGGGGGGAFDGLVQTTIVNVQREHRSDWAAFVAFQVAQTAVMFLLFSMAGAAGGLLEEQENGTLERILSSNMGMSGLLMGKWFVIALIGIAQLAAMFLWAWAVFRLELMTPHHLAGWAIMSIATAAAGSAFGMVLATACRSRGQLAGLTTIIILMMSALGGSMFPRFMMSENLQQIGLVTFNAWALDGYRKVFYDNLPLTQLWPQVSVLAALTFAFMLTARVLARRWEST